MTPEEKILKLEYKLDCTLELLKTIVAFTAETNDDVRFLIEEIKNIIRM